MPTIIDVAIAAGVSTATVSRVLAKSGQVTDATRRKVEEVIARLGYSPNVAARTLRTTRAGKLLITVPDISNPFFSNVLRGAEEAARDAGYSVVIGDTRHDARLENQYGEMLARKEVDGLVLLGHRVPDALAARLRSRTVSVQVVNGCECSPELPVPSVHIDNVVAAQDAIEHLLELGHLRIGVITGPSDSPLTSDRLKGARISVARHSGDARLEIVQGDYSIESGARAATDLINLGVTAIFCFSDEMAMGALCAIKSLGLLCPQQISLVGFDDIRFSKFMDPPLTTVAQPQQEIGRHLIKLLNSIINKTQAEAESVVLPHELVIRSSTADACNRGR